MNGWCQGGELNSRPRAYESPALPLSYPGKIAIAKEAKSKTVRPGFKSLCCQVGTSLGWPTVPGGIASPSGSRRMGNGAEHRPDKPVRR